MDPVEAIFQAFGGPGSIADATSIPVQTVCDWRKKGKPNIPHWRRPAVLDAALRKGVELSLEAVEYLAAQAAA